MFSLIFQENITLVHLDLKCNDITDQGCRELFPVIEFNQVLSRLILRGNQKISADMASSVLVHVEQWGSHLLIDWGM